MSASGAKPSSGESSTATEQDHQNELAAMKRLLIDTKVDGNKNLWTMTLDTFGMADGKHEKDDILLDSLEDGLVLLNEYVAEREKNMDRPVMEVVPLKTFDATQDQFLTSFLKWAEKEDPKTKETKINVSKASRRLDAYFGWMEDNRKDFEQPLTTESILETAKIWDVQVSYDDNDQFLWWIDLAALDQDGIKKFSNSDHLRYIVWFSHLVMFDKKAQENGALLFEDLGMIGFWKMFTLVPSDLAAKMDRLTIGILPVRMKKMYVFGAARWMTAFMAFLKPFLGKKMRERFVMLPRNTDMQEFCENLVTRKNIPTNFSHIIGEYPRDWFFEKFK